MVKVKLRVPLSSAPRDTSSPLANPLRSAPDYSDDDDAATPLANADTASVDHAGMDEGALGEIDQDANEDDDLEADELDEHDELEDEDDASTPAPSSNLTKKRSITLKSRSSHPGEGSASPSADGSASPTSSAAGSGSKSGKRPNLARIAQFKSMTVEELDALPAAKRRKTAKARGAAGPGRGWRKGLTKGQKPVYELPPAERTPSSFGNTADVPRGSVGVKAESPAVSTLLPRPKPIESIKSATPSTSVNRPSSNAGGGGGSIKIVSGPGGQTFTGDLSAKAGTAKNPGFRYPPLPSSRAGPPVQPLARIPTSFQSVIPLERNSRQPRRWTKGKREILSMGGRPWSIPVFYGGEDRGYEKKVDAPAPTAVNPATGGAGGETVASKAGTPSIQVAAKAASPTPVPTPKPAPATPAGAAAGTGGSPLPPPKHLGGLAAETNWRGQSPAFLFGGR